MAFDANDPADQEVIKNAIDEALKGVDAKKTELLGETKAEREKRRNLEAELEKLKAVAGDVDLDDYKRLKQAEAEQEKIEAEKKGEYEKLMTNFKEKSAAEIAEAKARGDELQAKLHNTIKTNEILAALSKEEGSVPLLKNAVEARTRIEEIDGKSVVVGLDEKGDPIIAEDGSIGTALDVVKHLKTIEEYQPAFKAHQMFGSGSSKSQGKGHQGGNPWKKDTLNLTQQGQILSSNPALAATLKREAGIS